MTLREYVNAALGTGSIHKVISCIQSVYYPDINGQREILKIHHAYTATALELINLPINDSHTNLKGIELVSVVDEKTSSEHIDVHGLDVSGETFAIEWIDWAEIIDLPVFCEEKLETSSILCHILYEITFNGYSRTQVLSNIDSLKQDIENTPEHNIIPFDPDFK